MNISIYALKCSTKSLTDGQIIMIQYLTHRMLRDYPNTCAIILPPPHLTEDI